MADLTMPKAGTIVINPHEPAADPAPIATQEVAEIVARIVNSNPWVLGQPADKGLSASIAVEIERLTRERDEALERLHYCNGTCDLAMKHRDEAEAQVGKLRDELSIIASLPVEARPEAERLSLEWLKARALAAIATEPDGESRG